MAGKIVLITGGARSGKSTFAEKYAASAGTSVTYIATAQQFDDEMKQRVYLHRQRRPQEWDTIEAPYKADLAITAAAQNSEVILFDCLTLYTSNLMLASDVPDNAGERYNFVLTEIDKLVASAQKCQKTVVFVTNETGMGIVPDNALAREYRDLSGIVNQKMGSYASEVYLVVCGLALEIKQSAVYFDNWPQ